MTPAEDLEDWPAPQDPSATAETATHNTAPEHSQSLKIKIPLMAPSTRASARVRAGSNASGSEYHESNASMDVDEEQVPVEEDESEQPPVEYRVTSRGRKVLQKSYKESDASEDDPLLLDPDRPPSPSKQQGKEESEEEDEQRYALRRPRKRNRNLSGFVETDEEEIDDDDDPPPGSGYRTRSKSRNGVSGQDLRGNGRSGRTTRRSGSRPQASVPRKGRKRVGTRRTRRSADDEGYEDEPSSGSADADGSLDDAPRTSPEAEPDGDADAEGEVEVEVEVDGERGRDQDQGDRPYSLRRRNPEINYAIPPPLEEMGPPPLKPRSNGQQSKGRNAGKPKALGWSATGAELSRWMGGGAGDDSDSDYPTRTPRKQPFGAGAMGGVFAGGGLLGDIAAAGTPSNLGKVGDATLADADPLGVNQNVTFDEVGGLDDHINSLKEMTLLPLLYPEVFQRFSLTPPRGVLFHGPPGTGKTLLARALAASCRSDGKKISFFMRKGADCLSKWVGEAERQLRLLFEEARNQQPSIIFFDEIDGLAPVRSSKQDQIHASIVSTLLALMDGMDGRGQVIVIGATNRPDAIDPALRRPGRFDREFYFPLPNLEARERILRIMTKKWAGWEDESGEMNVKGLAKLTKGYGGADLRALCTEAALNAVQRRYPQIYKSNDRLLLKPETIEVELRDFMIAVKKLVPSSARSVSSAASPLPAQLEPLLQQSLERMKEVIAKVLPVSKKRTALEEAEWEDESREDALDRELMLQTMETLRVYRPRVVLHGPGGMGQAYVASAVLHHLEGYHIQSLDLGSLMGDSARTPEAAIIQLFVEAKRHQPSVVYIPSLIGWCAAVSETVRTTVRAMLDTLAPTDPVLLLAVVDGSFSALPRDVRSWFGLTRDNRVELAGPAPSQREEFFEGLLKDVRRPPNQFPDGVKRKKRVLEELPIAPPLEPRQPTAAELAVQEENDQRVITLLRYRLGPILQELKRKFKRFTKRAMEEYSHDFNMAHQEVEVVTTTVEITTNSGGVVGMTGEQLTEHVDQPQVNGGVNSAGVTNSVNGVQEPAPQPAPQPPLFDMDLERMHLELYRNRYLTPDDFLDDIRKIVHNAEVRIYEDPDRLFRAQAMLTAAEVSINDFDPTFRLECRRMAVRERKRREEYRKNKEKEKEAQEAEAASQTSAPGPRRSTRHNGQPLAISITDPIQLEGWRKRHRSTSAVATGSEDENGDRASKRLRTEDDGPAATPSPEKAASVRFADDVEHAQTPILVPQLNGVHEQVPLPNESNHTSEVAQLEPEPAPEPELLRRTGGFDPSLLNPLPSPAGILQPGPSTATIDIQNNPFLSHDAPSLATFVPTTPHIEVHSPQPQPPSMVVDPSPIGQPYPSEEAQTTQSDVPMEIHRTPSPVPDFIVDEYRLYELQRMLRDDTTSLNVEQLEQLRAICLGCVWRRRSDWDRAELLAELAENVRIFVEEVSTEDMDAPSPGQ